MCQAPAVDSSDLGTDHQPTMRKFWAASHRSREPPTAAGSCQSEEAEDGPCEDAGSSSILLTAQSDKVSVDQHRTCALSLVNSVLFPPNN